MKPITLHYHDKPVNVVKFNLDGDLFFSAANDYTINVHNGLTFERLGTCKCKSSAVKSLAITEDSEFVIAGTGGGTIEVFKISTGDCVGIVEIPNSRIRYVELSYGGKDLMVVYETISPKDGYLKIIDLNSLLMAFKKIKDPKDSKELKELKYEDMPCKKHLQLPETFIQISFGLCNRYLIGITGSGEIYKFDSKYEVVAKEKIFDEGVSVCFSRDYGVVAFAGNDGCRLYDPDTMKCLKIYKQDFPMRAVAVSPLYDGDKYAKPHIVMGGGTPAREAALKKAGGTEIHIVHLIFAENLAQISGHFSPINSLVWFKDGGGIVSGAEEGIVKVFRFDKTYFEDEKYKQMKNESFF